MMNPPPVGPLTMLVKPIYDDALRYFEAFATRGWAAVLTELVLVVLVASFVLTAWRLLGAGGPHAPRSPTKGERLAVHHAGNRRAGGMT